MSDDDVVTALEPAAPVRRELPLSDAPVIVAGGRGMGGAEGFKQLE